MQKLMLMVQLAVLTISSGCWKMPVSGQSNRCVPPVYPEFTVQQMDSGMVYTIQSNNAADSVHAEYTDALQPEAWATKRDVLKDALWRVTMFSEGYLYECMAAANYYEVERGCVYIRHVNAGTEILLTWALSGDSVSNCQVALKDSI
jgi:hypothetical protein